MLNVFDLAQLILESVTQLNPNLSHNLTRTCHTTESDRWYVKGSGCR